MKDRVLVIDDEECIRSAFTLFIRGAGHDVETASSLGEGMDKIARSEFDLVLADILLGGDTGVDILRMMRERGVTCPLVFITGYPNLDTASEAVRLGAFDYLAKPVRKQTLLRVMDLALRHGRAEKAKERSRANLEAVFRSVEDIIVTVDSDLALLSFNKAAEEACELSPRDVGKRLDSLPKCSHAEGSDALERAVETGETVQLNGLEWELPGGRKQVVNLTASPLLDSRGFLTGAVMVVRNEQSSADLETNPVKRRQFHGMVGVSGRMRHIYGLIEDLAGVRTTVLITGESGTGKELIAEAIHHAGICCDKPMIKVNCSALSENLLESELFGHVKGAFTGAVRDKAGRFQLADGGTIFLDEIGDVSLAVQQRLLRVLQERTFERVGDSSPRKVNVRVIAATNKNLREKIRSAEFREDLYYRLKVVEITPPPLRERNEDIPLLVEHFIGKLNAEHGKKIHAVSKDVLSLFMNHPWPGNVRQLAHTIEHAFIPCRGSIITMEHLPPDLCEGLEEVAFASGGLEPKNEREAILDALKKTAGNKARAARLLKMSRATIYRKIEEHGIVDKIQAVTI